MYLNLKKTACAALLPFLPCALFAQAPNIQWQNTVGGSSYEFLNAIAYTSDGGVIAGGYSESNISGDKTEDNLGGDDYWIVKFNNSGAIEWENTIGGGNYDRLYSVEETPDGGFIIGGQSLSGGGWGDKSESNMGGYDYWVVKIDDGGNIEWDNTIGGTGNDQLYSAQPTSDGGYILAGTSDSGISGDKTENRVGNSDYWVVKLNASGTIVWQNDIGGVMFENLYSAYETLDGGFILAGTSTSGISGDKTEANFGNVDYWIVKINAFGVLVWEKTIGSTSYDYVYTAIPTDDGGSLAIGMSDGAANGNKTEATSGQYDYWLVKMDNTGNITWQNSIGGFANDYVFVNAGVQQPDGNYLIAGYSVSTISGDKTEANTGSWDYWVLQLNSTGSIIWQSVIGGSSGDYANAIDYTPDGGLVVGGYSYSNTSGEKTENTNGDADYWVVRYEGNCIPATEICNGIDDDCDGITDEGIAMFAVVIPEGATTFCQGGSVLLTSEYSGDEVQWTRNGANIPGATTSTYTATQKGVYAIVTSNECASATSPPVNIIINKNPSAVITAGGPTTFCVGGNVMLSVTAVAGSTYQWYKGATAIPGATGLTFTASTPGNYKCRVTKTATGCFKNSNSIAVSVPCKDGEALSENTEVNIYPNPASDYFSVDVEATIINEIKIYSQSGALVKHITGWQGEQIYAGDLPKGIYALMLVGDAEIFHARCVLE